MVSGARFVGKKDYFHKNNLHILQEGGYWYLAFTARQNWNTYITHLIKGSIPPYKPCMAFCLVGLCKEKNKPCRKKQDGWAELRFVLCYSSWSPVITVVFSNVANLPQTAQKATWKVHHVHSKIQVWDNGDHIGTYVLLEHTDFLLKKAFTRLVYKMVLSQQRLWFPPTSLTERKTKIHLFKNTLL